MDFVWGTQCYFATSENYCCMPVYDPTRQEWHFTIELEPGPYYVNIDGWSWSTGCGDWWWSENWFLNLSIDEQKKERETIAGSKFNVLGQQIKQ